MHCDATRQSALLLLFYCTGPWHLVRSRSSAGKRVSALTQPNAASQRRQPITRCTALLTQVLRQEPSDVCVACGVRQYRLPREHMKVAKHHPHRGCPALFCAQRKRLALLALPPASCCPALCRLRRSRRLLLQSAKSREQHHPARKRGCWRPSWQDKLVLCSPLSEPYQP